MQNTARRVMLYTKHELRTTRGAAAADAEAEAAEAAAEAELDELEEEEAMP